MSLSKNSTIRIPRAKPSIISRLYHMVEPYLFLLPAFIISSVFLFFPFGRTIYLSFFLTDKLGQAKVFWSVKNYLDLFGSSSFWASVSVTFQFVLIVAFGGLLMGLITSLLTANEYRGVTFASASYAMPLAIASAAASMTFKMILHPTNGLLNILLNTQINWTGDRRWGLFSVAVTTIWLASGINFIFISAGLRNVPGELYESASIDGANYWQRLLRITLPSISPTLFFQIIINIIGAFQSFSQIRLLTDGGPGEATSVIVYAIYRDAFFNFRYGTAAARSIILFVIVLIITLIQFSFERRSVHY